MILLVLIALAAKVDASPTDDARAEAIRYANILTGDDPDTLTATDGVGDDDCDDDDCDGDGDDDRDYDDRDDDRNEYDRADNAEDSGVMTSALASDDDRAPERGADDAEDRGAMTSELANDDDAPERGADLENISSDLAGTALAGHIAGELAMLEAGGDSGDVIGDDVSFAATSAGAAETYESWMRHQRPSPWGRVDLGVAWRRRGSEPMSGMSRRYDEVWLVATWRR